MGWQHHRTLQHFGRADAIELYITCSLRRPSKLRCRLPAARVLGHPDRCQLANARQVLPRSETGSGSAAFRYQGGHNRPVWRKPRPAADCVSAPRYGDRARSYRKIFTLALATSNPAVSRRNDSRTGSARCFACRVLAFFPIFACLTWAATADRNPAFRRRGRGRSRTPTRGT